MTPRQKLRATLLKKCNETAHLEVSEENVDDLFYEHYELLRDTISEFRWGEFSTDIKPDECDYYESRSVGAKMVNGDLVGWTFYYGGGKYAEPWRIEWMDEVYNLKVDREYYLLIKSYKITS